MIEDLDPPYKEVLDPEYAPYEEAIGKDGRVKSILKGMLHDLKIAGLFLLALFALALGGAIVVASSFVPGLNEAIEGLLNMIPAWFVLLMLVSVVFMVHQLHKRVSELELKSQLYGLRRR